MKTIFAILIAFIAALGGGVPMGYDDIVEMGKPQLTAMSPKGDRVAYTVRKGHIEENCNRDELFFYDVKGNKSQKILEIGEILQIEWDSEGKNVFLLAKDSGRYLIMGGGETLASFEERVSKIALGSNHLYYSIAQMTPDSVVQDKVDNGYVYQWGEDNCFTLQGNQFKQIEAEEIRLLDVKTGTSKEITQIPCTSFFKFPFYSSQVIGIFPSYDDRFIALNTYKLGRSDKGEVGFSQNIVVWDIQTQREIPLFVGDYKTLGYPCWVSDRELLFVEKSWSEEGYRGQFWVYDLDSEEYHRLDPKREPSLP